jgi:hypothetical protein
MPPIRSESSHKLANQEGKILLALSDLKEGRISSIRAAAMRYPTLPYMRAPMAASRALISAHLVIN